jgi:hypothetical protein
MTTTSIEGKNYTKQDIDHVADACLKSGWLVYMAYHCHWAEVEFGVPIRRPKDARFFARRSSPAHRFFKAFLSDLFNAATEDELREILTSRSPAIPILTAVFVHMSELKPLGATPNIRSRKALSANPYVKWLLGHDPSLKLIWAIFAPDE